MRFSFCAASLAAALVVICTAADAQTATMPRTLTVNGTGEVRGVPDQAQLSTGVVTQAATAAAALASNSRVMNSVFDALKRAGIARKSIQTSNFSVSPQYASTGGPSHIAAYQVSNIVTVVVDKLDKVGPALAALVTAGSNHIDGPSFSIADPGPLLAKARERAVKDATARAKALAAVAGITLGPIVSISESGGYTSSPQPMYRLSSLAMAGAPDPPPPDVRRQEMDRLAMTGTPDPPPPDVRRQQAMDRLAMAGTPEPPPPDAPGLQPMDRLAMAGTPDPPPPDAPGEEIVLARVSITWGIQ